MKRSGHAMAFSLWVNFVLGILCLFPCVVMYVWGDLSGISARGWLLVFIESVFMTLYIITLALAYEAGDLSVVYPLSRGSAPLFLTIMAVSPWVNEKISLAGGLGIASLAAGVYFVNSTSIRLNDLLKPLRAIRSRASVLSLITGVNIAFYHIFGKLGTEEFSKGKGGILGAFEFITVTSVIVFLLLLVICGAWSALRSSLVNDKVAFSDIIISAVLIGLAYFIVLYTLTLGNVSYIAPLRNFSVVISVILGITVLKEPQGSPKLFASILIFIGILFIAFA
ncbi:MAG: EamA family transporter [bacterium]